MNNNGGKFNETLKLIFAHPFATFFILDTTLCGIANIVRAARGMQFENNVVVKELKRVNGKINEQSTTE